MVKNSQSHKHEYEMELDEVYYKKLLNADFIIIEDMIFIKNHLKDLEYHIKYLQNKQITKTEIEQTLNHIVMEFISTFHEKQKTFAKNIIKSWRKTLKRKFPKKQFVIELVNEGGGYVIYLYSERPEEK